MSALKVSEDLWSSAIMPEGILERWHCDEGQAVECGDPVALVRIEDSLHEILAPESGILHILVAPNTVIDPGTWLGDITS